MSERESNTITGELFDETTEISVSELCKVCSVQDSLVHQLVNEGILEPVNASANRGATESDELRFHFTSVRRTRTVLHLQNDLGVNLAGAALALELLDRIEDLRRQL